MADIKQMGFVLLVLLVSISGIYEWAASQPVLGEQLGVSGIGGFEADTLESRLLEFETAIEDSIETALRVDIFGFITSFIGMFSAMFDVFMKLMFGWQVLVDGIFASVGLESLSIIFVAPLTIIQMFTALYFLRDIINTIRGVGG